MSELVQAKDVLVPQGGENPTNIDEDYAWFRQEIATLRNLLDTEKEVSQERGANANRWHEKYVRVVSLMEAVRDVVDSIRLVDETVAAVLGPEAPR